MWVNVICKEVLLCLSNKWGMPVLNRWKATCKNTLFIP